MNVDTFILRSGAKIGLLRMLSNVKPRICSAKTRSTAASGQKRSLKISLQRPVKRPLPRRYRPLTHAGSSPD